LEPVHGHSTNLAARTAANQKSFLPEVPQGTARMGPARAARLQRPAWSPPRPSGAAEGHGTAMPSPRGCWTLKSRTDVRLHAPRRPAPPAWEGSTAAGPMAPAWLPARAPAPASRYCERARRAAPPGRRPQPTASPAKPCALCARGGRGPPPPSGGPPRRGCRRACCVAPTPAGCEARPAAAAAPRRRPCGHLIKKAPSARARPRGISHDPRRCGMTGCGDRERSAWAGAGRRPSSAARPGPAAVGRLWDWGASGTCADQRTALERARGQRLA